MQLFQLPSETAGAEFLAWEEAILDAVDAGESEDALCLWESHRPFVVLGCGQRAEAEADLERCHALGVPVFRRCSGGGAVVQGPGCLNYAVILRHDGSGPLASIQGTNRWVMERQKAILRGATGTPIELEGHTDLVLEGRKFSGNAQRRKREALLFHGTLLLDFQLATIAECLRFPTHQPGYRAGREHLEFVRNLPLGAEAARDALIRGWKIGGRIGVPPQERFRRLWEDRYSRESWHRRL
jgi:lipoate-protein ligase A